MITVVVPTLNSAHLLGGCLPGLVPAAVDGLVREVVFADAGSTDGTLALAEDCGARVATGESDLGARLAVACEQPRGDWLLVLEPDATLLDGWRAPIEQALVDRRRAFWLPRPGGSWLKRLLGAPPQGLLVSVERYSAAGGFRSGDVGLSALVGRLRAARLG